MYRDILISLILKEYINDIFLCNYIKNYIFDLEIKDNIIIHKSKYYNTLQDIKLLYPSLLKTAIFENFRFDEYSNLDPGWCFYTIKPLLNCGKFMNWCSNPPKQILNNQILKEHEIKGNGIILINEVRKNYSNKDINNLIEKTDKYKIEFNESITIWYDFHTKKFTNISL